MPDEGNVAEIAAALNVGLGQVVRRLRQTQTGDDLTIPETSALARLDRDGPTTASGMAKREQISPQSMGATLAALEARDLVERRPDPDDGRRVLLSPTAAGRDLLRSRRGARISRIAAALATGFTAEELETLRAAAPLLERLAREI
jgi:DNA-binding MarR family transcriptional regulator